jgi:erythromycin esterase-like protein
MKYGLALVLAAALLAASNAVAQEGEARSALVEWMSANAIPFDTPLSCTGFDDLQPLKTVIGDARIVGLGEATHGTREHFQMKHRLVEFLAEEMGFTIFSIEASTPEAYRLNDYVLGGDGDPEQLIAGMYFWTWNTEEVLAMVEWMRSFNTSGRGQIQFTGFDMQTPDVAADIVVQFLEKVDPNRAEQVQAKYDEVMSARPRTAGFGVATMSFPVDDARGKHLKYTGYIKTEELQGGWAGLWWRVDCGEQTAAAFDNMMGRGPSGTTQWKRYTIELDIPEEATNINFGVLMPGSGKAWFDKLNVELDGEEYVHPDAFDFNFEATRIEGYYASNDGTYLATLDADERYSGKQSLRLEKVGDDGSTALQADDAARLTTEVFETMEANRVDYLGHATAEEVDWAIHNARIVDQSMRLRAGHSGRVRDESMSDNIVWILEQNPGAKIVLWAHNAHIARWVGVMGGYLNERFGADYLPVAFTAAAGQYRAVGKGRLGVHDLDEPPDDSIESVCAATGAPRLIVDLRTAPRGWLTKSRKMRSIGAMAMDEQFFYTSLPQAFDVLVYFQETSPSIPLGANPASKH